MEPATVPAPSPTQAEIEHRLHAALARNGEAATLYAWMTPAHRDVFLDFVRGEDPAGIPGRIDEVVDILAGRPLRPS